jgi:acetyl esterase/lipase
MPLDPQVAAYLERLAQAGAPDYDSLTPEQVRSLFKETRGPLLPPPQEVASVVDKRIPGPGGPLAVRIYRPLGSSGKDILPALVYFHGGGWVVGDLDTHDTLCRQLSNEAKCVVVAVDYRLAPEHKFPAAVEDAVAATRWVATQSSQLGVDPDRLAVGGDSAGGNLATVVAITFRDSGGPELKCQLLIYAVTDQAGDTPSHSAFAEGYMLTRARVKYFQKCYLRGPQDFTDWRASPLKAPDLSNLPAALVVTAGFDVLRDEGKAYADRLSAAGVPVTYECYEGMIHGFFIMGGIIDQAKRGVSRTAAVLARALGS